MARNGLASLRFVLEENGFKSIGQIGIRVIEIPYVSKLHKGNTNVHIKVLNHDHQSSSGDN